MTAVSAPINMETFENAIHQWFFEATEIETVWANTAKTMPDYPVGVLQLIAGPIPVAPQFEIRNETNLSLEPGSEIITTACVQCTFTVSCQVWVGGDDRWHPAANARYYLAIAQAALGLPSYLAGFKASEVSVVRSAAIQDISSVQEEAIIAKANMDVTFGAALNATEYNTYIEKMAGEGTFTGSSQTINREFGDI